MTTPKAVKLLMCPPSFFQIHYKINPWMKLQNRANVERAHAQWQGLYLTLQGLGAKIQLITPEPGLPDMVFTANAGIVRGRTFMAARFRHSQRQGEEPLFRRYFKNLGYKIQDAGKAFFEGEGDLLPYRDMYFGGLGFRSERLAHEHIAAKLKKRIISLTLRQPHFYHLDTCFLPLDERSVLYYPGAFEAEGLEAIRETIENPIPVSSQDAHVFACNGVRIGRTVVINKASRAFHKRLAKEGYEVVETPTSEFMKAGGSVKCLTLTL